MRKDSGRAAKEDNIAERDGQASGSIARAVSVLDCISQDSHSLTDIAAQCKLGKSTVHRVLKLLEQSGLVIQDAMNRRYYLGPLITRLAANPVTTHEFLIMCANREMKHLSALSEETVALDILIGTQHFSLYEIPSRHDLRVIQASRLSGTLQTGASTRVLLSLLNDRQLKAALAGGPSRGAERVTSGKEQLLAQIKEIRREGYAVSYGERISGAMCVSAPLKNYSLPVAVSVVGPESRLRPKETEVITAVKASAAKISDNIARVFGKEKS
ncbi:MAG: IclR family transcriptional regulator [Dehalococcoidales bacterium]